MSERCWDHKTTGDGSQDIPSLLKSVPKERGELVSWNNIDKNLEKIHILPSAGEIFQIKKRIQKSFPIHIKKLIKVYNKYLLGCFLLKKEECMSREIAVKEEIMYHVTAPENVNSIITNNFDWRRTFRSMYGQGVCFFLNAKYANKQCNPRCGSERALIIASVLVGKKFPGEKRTELPPKGHDTTSGKGGNVLVKFYDNEFYPKYVVYYKAS